MLKQLMRRMQELSRIHRDIGRVRELDDHLLKDMGFDRDAIATTLRHGRR